MYNQKCELMRISSFKWVLGIPHLGIRKNKFSGYHFQIIEDLVTIFLKLKNGDDVRKQQFRYIIEEDFGEQKFELWQVEDCQSQKMTQNI